MQTLAAVEAEQSVQARVNWIWRAHSHYLMFELMFENTIYY